VLVQRGKAISVKAKARVPVGILSQQLSFAECDLQSQKSENPTSTWLINKILLEYDHAMCLHTIYSCFCVVMSELWGCTEIVLCTNPKMSLTDPIHKTFPVIGL
jgi:hypothetical protein